MIRQVVTINHSTRCMTLEVGTRDSAIRVEFNEEDVYEAVKRDERHKRLLMRNEPGHVFPDFQMLYEYLADSGRVIHLTPDIAFQTIQFLKETN